MTTTVADLVAVLRADNTSFDTSMANSGQAIQGLSDTTSRSNTIMSAFADGLTAAATVATAAFVGGVVSAAVAAKGFLDMTAQAQVSLQGFGESGVQAADNIQQVVKAATDLGVPQAGLLKTSELLQAAGGAAINNATTMKALSGTAETTGIAVNQLASQLGLLYQMYAQGDTQGTMMVARQLVREQALPQSAIDQMKAMATAGEDINKIWAVVMDNLRGGSAAADQYAGTLKGVTQSVKDLFAQDSAMIFKPLYDEGLKVMAQLKSALGDPAIQAVLAQIGQEVASLVPNIDHLLSSIKGFATADGIKTLLDDVKQLAPLLATIGGMGAAGGLGALGGIPGVGKILGPLADIGAGAGALAGFLASSKETRDAVMNLVKAVGDLASSLAPMIGMLNGLLQAAAPVAAMVINAAAAVVSFIAATEPLRDLLGGVIIGFVALEAASKIVSVLQAVGAAFTSTAASMTNFVSTEAEIGTIGTAGIEAQEAAMAGLNTATVTMIDTHLAASAAAEQAVAANLALQQSLNGVDLAEINLFRAQQAAIEGGAEDVVATVNLTRAEIALTAAMAERNTAIGAANAALTLKTEATAAAVVADEELTAAEEALALATENAAAAQEKEGVAASASLGPLGMVLGVVGALAMAFGLLGENAKIASEAQKQAQATMSAFNKNEPNSTSNLDAEQARLKKANDELGPLVAQRDALKKQVSSETGGAPGWLTSASANLESKLFGSSTVQDQQKQIQVLNDQINGFTDITKTASGNVANMKTNIQDAANVAGVSFAAASAAAAKAGIDMSLDPGSTQGIANLNKLVAGLQAVTTAAASTGQNLAQLKAELTALVIDASGKSGGDTFTVTAKQIDDFAAAIARARAAGADPTAIDNAQSALNNLSSLQGLTMETKRYADEVLKRYDAEQKIIQHAEQLRNANESLAKAYEALTLAQETNADSQEKLIQAQNDMAAAEANMVDALSGHVNRYWDLIKTLEQLTPAQQAYGDLVAAQVAIVNDLQTAYDNLNNTYTTMSQQLQILTDQQKTYQDILNAPLVGTSKYDTMIQQNKMSQDATQLQIDSLELAGVPTQDQRIVLLTEQLQRLKLAGDQLNLQKNLDVGNQNFQLTQLKNTMTEITFQQAVTAATNLGQLNQQVNTLQGQMDIAKISVDNAKNALDNQNRTVTIQVSALQALAAANTQLTSAQDQAASSAQAVTNATQAIQHAIDALHAVEAAQVRDTLAGNAAMAASTVQYAQEAVAALAQLATAANSTSASISTTMSLQNQSNFLAGAGAGMAIGGGNYGVGGGTWPHYATGGLVESETFAHLAESGRELVLPITNANLSRSLLAQYAPELITSVASAPSVSVSSGGNSNASVTVSSGAIQVAINVPPGLSIPPELVAEIQSAIDTSLGAILSTYMGTR